MPLNATGRAQLEQRETLSSAAATQCCGTGAGQLHPLFWGLGVQNLPWSWAGKAWELQELSPGWVWDRGTPDWWEGRAGTGQEGGWPGEGDPAGLGRGLWQELAAPGEWGGLLGVSVWGQGP